jgi:hypothetical protein
LRSFVLGLLVIVVIAVSVLSFRPGGLRRQLAYAARRFRIILVLGGIYVFASTVLRLAFPQGPVTEYAPLGLAIVLAVIFLIVGRDPATPPSVERRARDQQRRV